MSLHIELAVVLPEGGTLRLWKESGVFDLPSGTIPLLARRGIQISIVSFGGREEFDCKSRLPGMKILCNWMDLPTKVLYATNPSGSRSSAYDGAIAENVRRGGDESSA